MDQERQAETDRQTDRAKERRGGGDEEEREGGTWTRREREQRRRRREGKGRREVEKEGINFILMVVD